jgi:hypothetical protein
VADQSSSVRSRVACKSTAAALRSTPFGASTTVGFVTCRVKPRLNKSPPQPVGVRAGVRSMSSSRFVGNRRTALASGPLAERGCLVVRRACGREGERITAYVGGGTSEDPERSIYRTIRPSPPLHAFVSAVRRLTIEFIAAGDICFAFCSTVPAIVRGTTPARCPSNAHAADRLRHAVAPILVTGPAPYMPVQRLTVRSAS